MVYPPGMDAADFAGITVRHREDAVQEAWVAHLEGVDPRAAAKEYANC